jgi:hypothetical protein
VAQVHHSKVHKALGPVAPKDVGTVKVQHRIDEQAAVARRRSDQTGSPGPQVLAALPLVVSECVAASHWFSGFVAQTHQRR